MISFDVNAECEAIHKEFLQCIELQQYEQGLLLLRRLAEMPGMMDDEKRRCRIECGLASAYALLGDKDNAITSLRKAAMCEFLQAEELQQNASLTSLQQEPEYQEIIAKLLARRQAMEKLWENAALNTPYREGLSEEEKIAGLSKFWAEAKYNFAFFDHVPELNWDTLYLEYLPKVRAATSTLAYYRLLQELCARLKDGHTGIFLPNELQEMEAPPGISTRLIEGTVLITEVFDEALRREGILPGLEITAIDGIPVHSYAEQYVQPYQSASTRQDLEVRTYSCYLLCGPKDHPVTLALTDAEGRTITRSLPRTFTGWKAETPFVFSRLDNNIAHVQINTMMYDSVVEKFDQAFEEIATASALILDVRKNSGGNSGIGWGILAYLTDKPFLGLGSNSRAYNAYDRAQGRIRYWTPPKLSQIIHPHGQKLFTGPVAVLTGAFTGSAAEDFCLAFDQMQRGVIIGEPTAGTTGQPLCIQLPGGGRARICTLRCYYPDGREFVGKGIQPQLLIRPSVADLRAGRDPVLEEACRYLPKSLYTKCV